MDDRRMNGVAWSRNLSDAGINREKGPGLLENRIVRVAGGGWKRPSKHQLRVLAAMGVALVFVSTGQADENPTGDSDTPSFVVKTFRIPDGSMSPDLRLADTTVNLVGELDSKSFGLSYRGTLAPETELLGTEKLVGYFYLKCDDDSPSETKGTLVGSVTIADIKPGRDDYTLIVTADASAYVPLKNVECVKVGVR
jgi:hypothetical protein